MNARFDSTVHKTGFVPLFVRVLAIFAGLFPLNQTYAQGVDDAVGVPVRVYWKGIYNAYPSSPASGTLNVNLPADGLTTGINAELNVPSGAGGTTSSVETKKLMPGKNYAFAVRARSLKRYVLSVVAPEGFAVEMDGVVRTSRSVKIDAIDSTADSDLDNDVVNVRLVPTAEISGRAGTASALVSGRIFWQVALGSLRNGESAGALTLADPGLLANWDSIQTHNALSYQPPSSEIQVDTETITLAGAAGGAAKAIKQIRANQAIVDIAKVSDSSYSIVFYGRDRLTGVKSATPYVSYLVDKTGVTALTITSTTFTAGEESRTAVTTLTRTGADSAYDWNLQDWRTVSGSQLSEELRTDVTTPADTANSDRRETRVVQRPAEAAVGTSPATPAKIATSVGKVYHTYGWGAELTEVRFGSGSNEVTTTLDYYTTAANLGSYAFLKSKSSTGGGWEAYKYDETGVATMGQILARYRPFESSPTEVSFVDSDGEVTSYTYSADAFEMPTREASVTTKIKGKISSKTTTDYTTAPYDSSTTLYLVTATRNDYSAAGAKLNTITKYFSEDAGIFSTDAVPRNKAEDFYRNQLYSVEQPDGVKQSFAYQRGSIDATSGAFTLDATGAASRIATITGVAGTNYTSYEGFALDPINLIPGKSTLQVVIRDRRALVTNTAVYVWGEASSGGNDWQELGSMTFTYDEAGFLVGRVSSNGATYSAAYRGEQMLTQTDETGLKTNYTYDDAGRIQKITKVTTGSGDGEDGPTTSLSHDAEGRLVGSALTALKAATGEKIASSRELDSAGRMISDSVPGPNGAITTSYVYLPASRQVTVNLPNGGTRVEEYTSDGRLAALSGTGVVAAAYTYTAPAADYGNFLSRVRLGSSTSRYRDLSTDPLGRTVKAARPGFSLNSQPEFVEEAFFDPATGRLTKTTSTFSTSAVSRMLFGYDELSRVNRRGLRLAGTDDVLDPASSDRIADSTESYVKIGADWWLQTTSAVYTKTGAATPTLSATSRQRLFPSLTTIGNVTTLAIAEVVDAENNVATVVTKVDRSTKTVTRTTTASGRTTGAGTGVAPRTRVGTLINGLVKKTVDFDGLEYVTDYDELERIKTSTVPRTTSGTTARTGTTTLTYKTGSNYAESVKDAFAAVNGGTSATYGYDSAGRVSWVQDATGMTTYSAYNKRDQLIRRWGSGAMPVEYAYNVFGERIAMRTFRNPKTTGAAPIAIDFSQPAWPAALSDSPLDATGTPDSSQWLAANGDQTTWTYDEPSGLLASKTDAKNLALPAAQRKAVNYTYNARGQTATRQWARPVAPGSTTSVTTTYSYYGDSGAELKTGELKQTSYNDGTPTVSSTYTRIGQLDSVTDVTGTRDFIYDEAHPNRLASEVLSDGFYAGRMLTQLYSGGAGTFGGYQTAGVAGRRAGFMLGVPTNPGRDLRQDHVYADTGRFAGVVTRSVHAPDNSRAFVYAYAPGTALVSGYAAGSNFTVSREFEDPRNLVTRVQAKWGGATIVSQFDLKANALGQTYVAQQSGTAFADYTAGTAHSSVYHHYTYNGRGELQTAVMALGTPPATLASPPTQAAHSPVSTTQIPARRFEYRYDQAGNRVTAGHTGTASGGDDEYAAESLNEYKTKENNAVRVVGTAAATATVTATGTAITRNENSFGGMFSPANLAGPVRGTLSIAASSSVSGTTKAAFVQRDYLAPPWQQTMGYDEDGNLLSDGLWTYTYDGENQLVRMSTALPAGFGGKRYDLVFKYDYAGRRVEKQVIELDPAPVVIFAHRYLYDGFSLIAETTATGAITRSYTWGLDMAGSLAATGGVGALLQVTNHNINGSVTAYFPSIDGNGNVVALTREDGLLAAVYEYSPFGEALRAEKFDPAVGDQPFRFSSKFTDDETGLIYYGARYYSPGLGRFINRDPIEEAGGLNLYGFVGNDAVNNIDFLGFGPNRDARQAAKAARKAARQAAKTAAAANTDEIVSLSSFYVTGTDLSKSTSNIDLYGPPWAYNYLLDTEGFPKNLSARIDVRESPAILLPAVNVVAQKSVPPPKNYLGQQLIDFTKSVGSLAANILLNADGLEEARSLWNDAENFLPADKYGARTLVVIGAAVLVADVGLNFISGGTKTTAKVAVKEVVKAAETTAFKRYMRTVETLDVSTARNAATFYSGPGNRALAESFATANGRTTLEMTRGGSWLDGQKLFGPGSPLTPTEATAVWSRLSERFAQGASGNAVGFSQGARAGSIFNTVEFPALLRNPNVTNVITGGF